MLNCQVTKDEGMGPYLYVLQFRSTLPGHVGELMTSVFTRWSDLDQWRSKLQANGIATTWDLAVDHMARPEQPTAVFA